MMKKSILGFFNCDLPEVNPVKSTNRLMFVHRRDSAVRPYTA